jgi:hypothetical protein
MVSLVASSDSDHSSCHVVALVPAPVYGCVKGRSVESDNMQFHANATKDYSLYALLLAVPPPWGSHLSRPPEENT